MCCAVLCCAVVCVRGRCDRADRGDKGWEGGGKVTGEGTCGCLLAVLEEVRGRDGWDGEKEEGGSVVFGGRTCEWEGESSKRGGRERERRVTSSLPVHSV